MNRYELLSILVLISGISLIILGVLTGEVKGGLFLIFPFIIGSGIYATLGILLIIASFFLFIFTISTNPIDRNTEYNPMKTNSKIHGRGIILLGPIPIIIGSNWKITLLLITIAIIFLLIANYFLV
jgi:uncharacterized protein (TIGR00304 family)